MRIYVIVGLLVMTLCGLNLYVIHTTVGTCTHNLETKSARVTWLESQLKRMKRGNEDLILQVRQDRKALQRLTQAQRRLKARLEQVAAHSPQLPTTAEAPGPRHAAPECDRKLSTLQSDASASLTRLAWRLRE